MGCLAGYINNSYLNAIPNAAVSETLFTFALIALLFVFGFSFSAEKETVQKMRKTGWRIVMFPLFVALGSLIGGLVAGLVLQINLGGAMAVSSGYGWYTLSGPMMGQLMGAQWGTLAFVANFLRELITIVAIPLMVRLDKLAPVASGGGTTMDTTLGVIVRYSGKDALMVAFANGLILSIMAPFAIVTLSSLA